MWAFSTTAEDVMVRSRMYARLGAPAARRLLAVNFPGGSARNEIKRRISSLSDKGLADQANVGSVVEMIVEELAGSTKVKLNEVDAKKA